MKAAFLLWLAKFLARPDVTSWLIARAARRPYSDIVKGGEVHMRRGWIFNPYPDTGRSGADRKKWSFPISIRVHHIILPDQDRDLHVHPWNARSFVLLGAYRHQRRYGPGLVLDEWIRSGDTTTLDFGEYHRITDVSPGGVYTLFVTGVHRSTWGFLVDGVKVEWRKYLGLEAK